MRTPPLVLAATRANAFDLPTVKIDDEQAGFDAVKYLVQKGHSDIVMISGPEDDLVAGLPRYQGFWRGGHRELLARGGDLAGGRVEFADFATRVAIKRCKTVPPPFGLDGSLLRQ